MELEIEKRFRCPYCRSSISMLIDLSEEGEQTYIEDCEVCCKPIQIMYRASEGQLMDFDSEPAV